MRDTAAYMRSEIHENTHSYRQLWESVFIVTHRHLYCRAASEQCKATHPVCVIQWPVGPLCPPLPLLPRLDPYHTTPALTPHSIGPTLLISSASFGCRTQTCVTSPSSFLLSSPNMHMLSNLSSFLLIHSHISETTCLWQQCWLDARGQSRAECQGLRSSAWGQEKRRCGGGWLIPSRKP